MSTSRSSWCTGIKTTRARHRTAPGSSPDLAGARRPRPARRSSGREVRSWPVAPSSHPHPQPRGARAAGRNGGSSSRAPTSWTSRPPPEAFLWFGRFVPYKRPVRYVELAHAVPEARFVMIPVPDEASSAELAELRASAEGVPNLELLDPVPHEDLPELVASTVAVVNTSVLEGMPNAFLEAWARGVPALTLAFDPDRVVERHALGIAARDSWDRFVAGARAMGRTPRSGRARAAGARLRRRRPFDGRGRRSLERPARRGGGQTVRPPPLAFRSPRLTESRDRSTLREGPRGGKRCAAATSDAILSIDVAPCCHTGAWRRHGPAAATERCP